MLGQEKPQDFELIELLIREAGSNVASTSTQQGSDFESFKARFQSYIDQVPSYLHSVGKEGFFPHFFLGSFSTLVDTEIATKLNIEKIYFSFDSSKTLKVAVIKNKEIKSPEDVADKVKLFVIAESGSTRKKFSYGELDKILGNTKVARNNVVRLARDQGKLGVRLVEITKEKDAKGKMAGISVNVESNKLDNDASTTHEFKEIKKGVWNNPESDIAKLTNPDVEKVKEPIENILKKVSKVHSEYGNSLTYAQGTREAAHHGFVAGALVNFRYRHNLRVYLEQFAGRGYADIVLVPRGKDRLLNAVPIIIELKAGTGAGTKSGDALEQAKDYAKGFQPNTMRVLTVSDNVLCVGLNLDSTEGEKFSMHISPPREREPAPPTVQKLLEVTSNWNGEKSTITDITEKIKQPLERIYHIFPGTPEKGGNYFSRFLLGQLLLANEFKRINLEKSVFLYNKYPLTSSARSGLKSTERPVTTFMLTKGNQEQDKEVFIFHVKEGGRGSFSKKKIPIDLSVVIKITEVYISLQEEGKSDFFNVEQVERYSSLDEYKKGKELFDGELKNIPYPAELKETFDKTLESQRIPQSSSVALDSDKLNKAFVNFKELFEKIGKGIFPLKPLIEKEAHFQAVLHGAFSYYSDIKLGELQENRALVLTEFQTGRGKRIDMLIHGIKFAEVASNAKEYHSVGIEIKGPREGKDAVGLLKEADNQIEKEYKEGVTYKTLTDGNKVFIMGVVFDNKAQSSNSLIKITDKWFPVNVIHSSKVKGNIDKLKRPALHKLFNRGLNALRSFEVHSGGFIPDWVYIKKDRLKDSNKDLVSYSSPIFFKKNSDFRSYLDQIPEDISALDLSEMDLDNSKMKILSNFLSKRKNINSIDLSCNRLNSVQVSGLVSFLIRNNRKISFLDLSQNDIGSNGSGSEAIESLAKLIETNNIDNLIISNIEMTSDDFSKIFRALKKNISIKNLDCSFNKVVGGFNKDNVKTIVDFLYNNLKLTALSLANTGINDCTIKDIEEKAQKDYQGKTIFIEELDIGNYDTEEKRITKEGAKSLAKLLKQVSKLKILKLSGNPIGVEGLKELVSALKIRNTDIETLDISEISLECNQDNAESIADIMKSLIGELNIRELNLADNQLNAKAIGEIFSSMKNREEQVLKKLNLAFNSIGDKIDYETVEVISSSLENNDVLESLDLTNMDLSGADIDEFVEALRKETIVDLNISGNDIYVTTTQELSEFLRDNSKLRFLNIANYDSEEIPLPEGIESLFRTLKDHNEVLTHLNIEGYAFSDKSVNIIAKYLGSDIGIQYLSLANSKFTGDRERALNVLFEALKQSNLQALDIRDVSITDKVADKIIEYLKVNKDLQVLHISQGQLSKNQVEKLERASSKILIEVELRFNPTNAGCPQRVIREIGNILCVDSRDEEKVTEKEKKQRIKELFNDDKIVEKAKNIEFYDQLFKVSERVSRGETIDQSTGKEFIAKIENIDLNLIDPEIRDIVKEIKNNVENKEEIKNILKRSGVAEKIGKVAEGAGLAFTVFLVGKHIANGNIEGLGYDALNLWVMPKIGEKISGKMLELGTKLDSQMLKGFAPVMGRAIGNFAAFLGLAESIKARQNATDPADIKIADLNIATNSIFIAADVPAIVTETMSAVGMEAGIIGEFAGPVGAAVSVAVIVISQFVEAGLGVEKLTEQMNLTDQERHDLYWDFFLDKKIPDYIERDVEAKNIYKQYISKILDQFQSNYDTIAISLPSILVKKEEYATNDYSRVRRQIAISAADGWALSKRDRCYVKTRVVNSEFDFESGVNITHSPYTSSIAHNSRVIPSTIGNYNIVCGPYNDNIAVQIVSKKTLANLPSGASCSSEPQYNNMKLSRTIERWFLQEHMTDCYNAVLYKKNNPSGSAIKLLYISQNASINVFTTDVINVVFQGKDISLTDEGTSNLGKSTQNRYYFNNQLNNCKVYKEGTNFFYIAKGNFVCNLGIEGQKNIVVTQGNFTDSENIHSIIGSDKANHIEVYHADYVDGKGGNDVITVKNFTTIKGYFGDSIYGKGLVLLPIKLNDIGNITHANNITNIYNKSGAFISVDKQILVKTADGFFVTPTKVDTNTGRVTNLHVTKSIGSNVVLDDELDNLRKIDNLNFNITKQLSSANYHNTIGSSSNHIFYPDKEHHNFYWEAPSNTSHLYLFDNRDANITIAQGNGILDFSQLNCTLDDMPFTENNEGEIKINRNNLHVTLLPNYKDVTVTFNGEEYYKLQNGELERDYCSHSLKVDGRFSVNGTNLLNHHNCFTFDSDKVLFLKLNNDLLLLSDRGALSISDYYSSVHKNWDLSIGLNNRIMEPEEFGERADEFSSFRYYQPDEQGLQIYHNQPINKNDIGLVDLKDKSILDFDMKVMNDTLLLLHKNNTLVKIENWNTYQSAREMMFAFNDAIASNSKCIVSTCDSEDVIVEFNKEKLVLSTEQLFDAVKQNNLNKVKELINQGANINATDMYGKTPLGLATQKGYEDIVRILKQTQLDLDKELLINVQDGDLNKVKDLIARGASLEAKDDNGSTPLNYAAWNGQSVVVVYLVENGANLEAKNHYGRTALHGASLNNHLDIVEYLVKKGIGINATDENGWTSLHWATSKGCFEVAKFLIEKGASINAQAKDLYGKKPIHVAAENNNKNIIELLLSKGVSVDEAERVGNTPLHYTAWKGCLEAAKFLVDNGANVNVADTSTYGKKPIHVAAENNNKNIIEFLLNKGVNVGEADKNGSTPLHYAAKFGQLEVAKFLIEKGADINAKDKDEKTPLDLAIQGNYTDIVGFLKQTQLDKKLLTAIENGDLPEVRKFVSQGASVNAIEVGIFGRKPIHIAAEKNYKDIIEFLLGKGVSVDDTSNYGWTPLHYTASKGCLEVAKFLVDKGANINAQNVYGREPIHIAAERDNKNIIELLLNKGVSINEFDKDSWMPLHWASWNGHLDITEYLVGKGANINAKDRNGKTPLDIARDKGHNDVAEYLQQTQLGLDRQLLTAVQGVNLNEVKDFVVRGASLDTQDNNNGWTPIVYAARGSKWDMVKFLIAQGAKFNNEITYQGTPLHFAAQEGNLNMVQFLLDKGANIEAQDAYNRKPLHIAVDANRLNVVNLLLDRSANLKATDMYGKTSLDLAIQKGYEDIVEVLKQKQLNLDKELLIAAEKGDLEKVRESIRRGANVNVQDRQGWTPLFWAIQKNNFNIIELLLDNSADIKVKDNEGWTPLHWAVSLGSLDIVEHLVERGADVNASTADGRTPLDIARDKGYNNIVNYLEEELNKEREKPVQRKRRHHHGGHNSHHLSRKPRAIDSSNQPEIVASGGTRPSSWINGLLGWVKSSVGGLVSSVADKFAAEESENSKLGDTGPCSAGLEKMYSATIPQSRKSLGTSKGNIPNRSCSSNREKVRSNVTVVPEINTAVVDSALILGDLAVRLVNGRRHKQPIHENLLSPRERLMRFIDEDMIIRAIQQGKEKFGVPGTNMDEVEIIGNKTEIGK